MGITLKPHSVIKARLKVNKKGPVQAFLTQTCAKAMDKYVPMDTGTLAETVIYVGEPTSNVKIDRITYTQPYARYMYNGKLMVDPDTGSSWAKKGTKKILTDKDLHYNKGGHAFAGPHWDQRMWTAEKDKVIKDVQRFIEHGGY